MVLIEVFIMTNYLKILLKYLHPLMFIFVLYFAESDSIKQGEEELYNNIPNIKVYNSDTLLRDCIEIKGRTTKQILGTSYFLFDGNGKDLNQYYNDGFELFGWKKIESRKILNKKKVYYGDEIIYEKGDYRIALKIYPQVENKCDSSKLSPNQKSKTPHYEIFAGKKNVIVRSDL